MPPVSRRWRCPATLARWHQDRDHLAPVAERRPIYDTGTPQRALQKAVDARYPSMRAFFDAVADEVNVTPGSAKGTFYAFMRGNQTSRALPADQRAAYLKLTSISAKVLDEIAALRPQSAATPRGRDRLAELEAKVVALTEALDAAKRAHVDLRRRVSTLEKAKAPARARTRSLAAPQATRHGRKMA